MKLATRPASPPLLAVTLPTQAPYAIASVIYFENV